MTGLQKALAGLALLAAICAGAVIGAAGVGHKFGAWDFAFARYTLLEYGFFAAVASGGVAIFVILVGLLRWKGGGVFSAFLALAVAGGVAYVPWQMKVAEEASAPIHDISTDTLDPPLYVALSEVRKSSENGAKLAQRDLTYDPTNRATQTRAYPDIETYLSSGSPEALYARAYKAVEALGWQIAASVPADGRIEATSVSEWFGFKDDIVIRVMASGSGSKLDIRSASRVGVTDLGANADHIRAFMAKLNAPAAP